MWSAVHGGGAHGGALHDCEENDGIRITLSGRGGFGGWNRSSRVRRLWARGIWKRWSDGKEFCVDFIGGSTEKKGREEEDDGSALLLLAR